ncbi:MAG: VCBS repeat-containing protein [Planctomycetota bacterium]
MNRSSWLAVFALLAPGCGYGSAGLVGSLSGDGRGNAPPSLGGFEARGSTVTEPKLSPATIRLVLADAEADAATVELSMIVPSDPSTEHRLARVPDNPAELTTTPAGAVHEIAWDFAAEAALPANASYVEGVVLVARLAGGTTDQLVVGLGNDPPEISELTYPTEEVAGITPVQFVVSDSSDDIVDVVIEYQLHGEATWTVARPAGLTAGAPTPPAAFQGVRALRTGSPLVFFWDTDQDLEDLERVAVLRITPFDPVIAGTGALTGDITVDNNDEPQALIEGVALGLNPNARRGLPIPYGVIDDEGDPVRVLFQWRLEGHGGFPPLDVDNPDELAARLEDPAYRRAKQICSRFPAVATGHARPVDATRVELPELRAAAAQVLASSVESRQLQLLRDSVPTALAATWTQAQPLNAPAAALALGDGLTALVLDRAAGATTRLLEIELATGGVLQELATGLLGEPTAFTLDARGGTALVATDTAGAWRLFRVDLETGAVTTPFDAGVGTPRGPLRALVARGAGTALATAADGLWNLDWRTPGNPRMTLLAGGPAAPLRTPWGLALDTTRADRVWLAERDAIVAGSAVAGRVVSVGLRSGAVEPLAASFPQVTVLAPHTDHRLVALCEPLGATAREVRALALGRQSGVVHTLGAVPTGSAHLATGAANLVLVTDPGAVDLVAIGGIEQTRTLASFDDATAFATVTAPFAPAVRQGMTWRIPSRDAFHDPLSGSQPGAQGIFVWDSSDVGVGGRVLLRATPMDGEFSNPVETTVARAAAGVFSERGTLEEHEFSAIRAVDLDGDGDLDLVGLIEEGIAYYDQEMPRSFGEQHVLTATGLRDPDALAIADLDGDGDLDLMVADDEASGGLFAFLQEAPHTFVPRQLRTGTAGVRATVAAADLDGDGDVDLVSGEGDELVLLYQDGPLTFTAQPLPAAASSEFLALGDIDDDGDLDLVSGADGVLVLLYQDGPRSFTAQPLPTTGHPRHLALADVDGDGDLDLAVTTGDTPENAALELFVLTAPRLMVAQPVVPLRDFALDLVVADLDRDGAAEILVPQGELDAPGWIEVVAETSPGVFGVERELPTGEFPFAITAADLDGDGDVDVAAANNRSEDVSILRQEASGAFTAEPPLPTTEIPDFIVAADLDGNGLVDLLTAGGRIISGELTMFFQGVARGFPTGLTLPLVATPAALAAGDLDGDGDLDLVAGNGTLGFDGELVMLYQDAPRTFSAALIQGAGRDPVALVIADLDGNGGQDVITANDDVDRLEVRYQDTPRQFTTAVELPTGDAPNDVAAADVDGDGDLDLVVANSRSNDITIFLQDAPRLFTAQPVLATERFPTSIVATDLDGDGDLDLATTSGANNNIAVFLQDAAGAFIAQAPLPTGRFPDAVTAADLDGDGDVDLACINSNSDELSWFLQEAPGSFVAQPPLAVGDFPTGLLARDLDLDGDLDLVVANGADNNVAVLYQDVPGVFAPPELTDTGGRPVALVAEDFDGDGDIDVATGNATTRDVTVRWGR